MYPNSVPDSIRYLRIVTCNRIFIMSAKTFVKHTMSFFVYYEEDKRKLLERKLKQFQILGNTFYKLFFRHLASFLLYYRRILFKYSKDW